MAISGKYFLLLAITLLVLLPGRAEAFGAGNIASISKIEGHNWRHGDIEDMLATVACLKGHKWNSMMIKRVYFGNWLRDYSQAVDVATLKNVQAETIRVLVWILSFMSFGYATGEFEVTADRLGVYRPEEHIDNPKDYADNVDARKFDARLRGPVTDDELAIDPQTGMKNYIANERGPWATSAGYVRFSFARAIHFGRMYTHGPSGQRGREEDLCEALRCLGQGLHCMEDFGAHTNYTELVLRELGFNNVFPHTGVQTGITLHGKHVFPLVTGTFGGVDFFHSVLGEATDHFTQSEIDEVNTALADAVTGKINTKGGPSGGGGDPCSSLCDALSKVPGTGNLVQEALSLKASSDAQAAALQRGGGGGYDAYSSSRAGGPPQHGGYQQPMTFDAPPGSVGGPPGPNLPGTNTDPATIIPKIYPILEFRDKVVRSISAIISKIPGLEKLIENITERVTIFVLSLLAPFVQPLIQAATKSLKQSSSAVVESSANHQFEPWTDPYSTNPTHSMLSKDHFSNILNEPAGQVAATILQYVAPRVVYAWDHPDVPVDQVLNDCVQVFHHPAIRDHRSEIHNKMFDVVKKWVDGRSDRGRSLDHILSSESVRAGKNHSGQHDHSHGAGGHGNAGLAAFGGGGGGGHGHSSSGGGGHSSGPGGIAGGLLGALPGGLGGKIGQGFGLLNSGSGRRDGTDGLDEYGRDPTYSSTTTANTTDPYGRQPSPGPGGHWGSFQPYQSSYAGGQSTEGYTYNEPPPAGGHDAWGSQGTYSGGQGVEPSYTVPTAYQQGYENFSGGAYGQNAPPAPQAGGYGGGYQDPSQSQHEGGGRAWGSGGGNSGW